jgi:hypothetical protein
MRRTYETQRIAAVKRLASLIGHLSTTEATDPVDKNWGHIGSMNFTHEKLDELFEHFDLKRED